jgi:hypothetical protein
MVKMQVDQLIIHFNDFAADEKLVDVFCAVKAL